MSSGWATIPVKGGSVDVTHCTQLIRDALAACARPNPLRRRDPATAGMLHDCNSAASAR